MPDEAMKLSSFHHYQGPEFNSIKIMVPDDFKLEAFSNLNSLTHQWIFIASLMSLSEKSGKPDRRLPTSLRQFASGDMVLAVK